MREIKNEWKKINSVGTILALVIFILIGNVIITFLYHESVFVSKKALEEERELYQSALETCEEGQEDAYKIKDICMEKIAIIDYSIANDIPYQQLSVVSNLGKNILLVNFVVIFMMLLIYSMVSVEYTNGTWKYLVILTKGNYKKIMAKKKLASCTVVVGLALIFFVVAALYGIVVYKDWSHVSLEFVNGKVITGTYNSAVLNVAASVFTKGIVYGSLTFLAATVLKEKKIGIIGIVLMILFENSIYDFLNNFKISHILPYRYMHILENAGEYEGVVIGEAIVYIAVFLVIINLFTYYFWKKDKLFS